MKRNIRVSLTILVFCGGAWAQQAIEFGSVSGMIFDNYGDGLPDNTVVLSNPMLGVRRTMITTDDGLFNAAAVEPSRGYRLKVTRKGFADWESGDFQVALGQTLNLKINMRPAATSTHVEAVAVQQQMDQLKNGISFRIGSQQVEELPAPDLRLDPLVLLAPEANTEDASGQLAFHGVRSSNVFLTDGINTTDSFYPQKLGIASQLSQESVQEMQVLSSDFPAEFGRAM
ncbi:MAG TPA: carboxypeptidase-like regulatory domain-containing protein [Bryobacteraceae bacterium]|nr:carboxypeptidase-like regulatory domain-containing protein [Bryobacteraceae bacterium]